MSSSFYRINTLDLNLYDPQNPNLPDYPYNFPSVIKKYDLLTPTQDPNQEQINTLTTRSRKNQQNVLETSFQNSFLDQHSEALRSKIQNFIESIASCSEFIKKQTLKTKILQQNQPYKQDSVQILRSSLCQIKIQEKIQFQLDLTYEQKFKQFLDLITEKFIPQISSELITVSNALWLQYLKVVDLRMDQESLKLWGQNLVNNKFQKFKEYLLKTQQKCFEDDIQAVFPNFDEAMKEFLIFYTVTISLVIEECFKNPFRENRDGQGFKRGFSEDIDSSQQYGELEMCSFFKTRKYS